MQIDVVRHLVVRVIVEVKLDVIAFAHANEPARNVAAKGPEHIIDAVREAFRHFLHLEIDDDLRRMLAGMGGGTFGGTPSTAVSWPWISDSADMAPAVGASARPGSSMLSDKRR